MIRDCLSLGTNIPCPAGGVKILVLILPKNSFQHEPLKSISCGEIPCCFSVGLSHPSVLNDWMSQTYKSLVPLCVRRSESGDGREQQGISPQRTPPPPHVESVPLTKINRNFLYKYINIVSYLYPKKYSLLFKSGILSN